MPTYAIGDIQGCYEAFQCLLENVKFDKDCDQLWITGDMVNRGPQNLETLRFIKSLGDSARVVLGNHDLHLLAVANGTRKKHDKDTIDDILRAPDREELLTWLQSQELLYHDAKLNILMVHAGLPPMWTVPQALSLAAEVTMVLRSAESAQFFEHMYGNEPNQWREELAGFERLRIITNYLTRMRICSPQGRLDLKHKSGIENLPAGYQPWFSNHKLLGDTKVLFGHWAAINGRTGSSKVIALDTGCVWGGELTLYRIEDGHYFRCDCAARRPT